MDVNRDDAIPATSTEGDLYLRALDKILRDTEDGILVWTPASGRARGLHGDEDRYTVYATSTPHGRLRLHGSPDHVRQIEREDEPVPWDNQVSRGEARLFLTDEEGRSAPFPPARMVALQHILDNLLLAVRARTEGPRTEDFAKSLLGEA